MGGVLPLGVHNTRLLRLQKILLRLPTGIKYTWVCLVFVPVTRRHDIHQIKMRFNLFLILDIYYFLWNLPCDNLFMCTFYYGVFINCFSHSTSSRLTTSIK